MLSNTVSAVHMIDVVREHTRKLVEEVHVDSAVTTEQVARAVECAFITAVPAFLGSLERDHPELAGRLRDQLLAQENLSLLVAASPECGGCGAEAGGLCALFCYEQEEAQTTGRFEVRETDHARHGRYGIYDHKRHTFEGNGFLLWTDAQREAARLAVERADTWGTVVFTEAIPTPKHPERQHTVTRTGDIMARDEHSVTIIDLGHKTVTIAAADVIEVAYGTVVHGVRPVRQGRLAGTVRPVAGDIAGWTPERHDELRHAVAGRSVAAWFGEFMQRYNLGVPHADHDTVLRRTNGRQVIMNACSTAGWLLEQWNAEHADQQAA